MDKAAIYRILAAKWREAANHVENRTLKRCYAKRALTYRTLAVACAQPEAVVPREPPNTLH